MSNAGRKKAPGGEPGGEVNGDSNDGNLQSRREPVYISANEVTRPCAYLRKMLEHLVQFNPEVSPPGPLTALDDASAEELLSAKIATSDWLEEIGAPPDEEVDAQIEKAHARKAFSALTTQTDTLEQKAAITALKTPEAVRHITGMLTAYDWEFIEQAKELRGYTVAKIVEETTNTNPNIRLKALQLLGKVTEVGLFTEQIQVKTAPASDAELDARIKEKLGKFMGVIDVVDVYTEPEKLDTSGESGAEIDENVTDIGENPDQPDQTGA